MDIVGDLHTHSMVSSHAYSTIGEMCEAAYDKGFKVIAITDHGPGIRDGADEWHFKGFKNFLPGELNGVFLLSGAETNILLPDGRVDISEEILKDLDIVIASLHHELFEPQPPELVLSMLENILKNPYVDIFGHLGNDAFKFDYESIISRCNEYEKMVEINNHSFLNRKGSDKNCLEIAKLCKRYEVPVVVTSDAHSAWGVGRFEESIELLEKVDFPEELVFNSSLDNIEKFLKEKKGVELYTGGALYEEDKRRG